MKHHFECVVCGMPRNTAEDLPYDDCRGHRGAPPQAELLGELRPGAWEQTKANELRRMHAEEIDDERNPRVDAATEARR